MKVYLYRGLGMQKLAIPFNGDGPGSDLFIGEVIRLYVDEAIYEDGRIDSRSLTAVGRLGGSNYDTIGVAFYCKT